MLVGIFKDGRVSSCRRLQEEHKPKIKGKGIDVVSISEQYLKLKEKGFHEVEEVDHNKMPASEGKVIQRSYYLDKENSIIRIKYEEVTDTTALRIKVRELKEELANGDYKIIKCYEALLLNEEMPYDQEALVKERKEIRNQIKSLQTKIGDSITNLKLER